MFAACKQMGSDASQTGGKEMKKLLALLLVLTISLSMAACGVSEPAATEVPTEEVIPTVYLPFEGETLRVLCQSGSHAESARSMIPEFEEITGAKVELIEYGYQELHDEIQLDLVSYIGNYDVIHMDSRWDGEFAHYLEPLDDYIARDNYDMGVWIENILANCGQWQDSIVGIPTSCSVPVLAYRTDLIPNGIPKTWNEYRRVLSTVNRPYNQFYGLAVSKTPDQMLSMFNTVLWTMGGKWADEDWKVTVYGNEGRMAMNHLNSAKILSDPACLEWTPEDALLAFLEGKAAACETWLLQELLQKADDPDQSQIAGNWALGLIPFDKTGMTALEAWDTVIPVGSPNKDLAWEWIKMYAGSDMQNRFYDDFGLLSARKDFWEQEKVAGLAVIRETLDYANNTWRIPAFLEAEAAISETLGSFIAGKTYLDTALRNMDTEIKTALENLPPEEGTKNLQH